MDKTLNYLGLARAGSHLICGTDSVIKAMQAGKVKLIVLSSDASVQTKDKLIKKAFFYKVPILDIYDFETLQHATNVKAMVFAIDDDGLSKAILNSRA